MLHKPLTGCSWQISEGSDLSDHILIAFTCCLHGSLSSEGLHAQVKLIRYGVTIKSKPKVVV